MKLVATKSELLRALSFVGEATNRKAANFAASCALLKVNGKDAAEVSAFDGFMSASATLSILSGTKGAFGVPAADLLERARAMPDADITIAIAENKATMTAGKRKHTIRAIPATDLVLPPVVTEDARPVTLPADKFVRLLEAVAYAQHTDPEGKWHGTQLQFAPPVLRADAATGRGMATEGAVIDGLEVTAAIMIGAKSAAVLRKLLVDVETVTMQLAPSRMTVKVGACVLVVPLLSADIPDERKLSISTDPEHRIIVAKAALVDALKGIAPASTDKHHTVVLRGVTKGPKLELEASGESGDGADEIEASLADTWHVRLPLQQLTAALATLDCEQVEIGTSDPGRMPVLLQPPEQPQGAIMRRIIMPIGDP